MALPSNTENLAIRFAPYIEELHGFFTSCGMRFGSPEDIVLLAKSLTAPGSFHDDMSSMIRSIIYREGGTVPRAELLEIVVIAIGGAHIDEAAQEFHEPVSQLFTFVGGVLRSRWNMPPDDPTVSDTGSDALETPSTETQTHTEAEREAVLAASAASELHAGADGNPEYDPEPDLDTAAAPTTHIYSRARTIDTLDTKDTNAERPGAPGNLSPYPVPTSAPQADVVPGSAYSEPATQQSARRLSFWIGRRSWILGLCALVLALFAVLLLRHRSAVQTDQTDQTDQAEKSTQHSVTSHNSAAPASPKPTSHSVSRDAQLTGAASSAQGPASSYAEGPAPQSSTGSGGTDQQSTGEVQQPTPAESTIQASAKAPPQGPTYPNNPPVSPNPQPNSHPPSPESSQPPPSAAARQGLPPRANKYIRKGLFSVSSGVMAGNLISAPPPDYPKLARLARIEGQVILQAVVSRNGNVVDTRVLRGHRLLRGAAVHAVRRWRYRPYVVNGRATDVATIVTVDFSLHR